MEEIWKKIKRYENYEVSNFGRVKRNSCSIMYSNGNICNYNEKILKQEDNRCNSKGCYKRVTLCTNNKPERFQTHRLVSEYFIPNPLNKPCVNHIDGDPGNNNVNNLEWVTHSENERHSYDVLGKINPNRSLKKEDVIFIRKNYIKGVGGNIFNLSKLFNVSRRTILGVVSNIYYKEWV